MESIVLTYESICLVEKERLIAKGAFLIPEIARIRQAVAAEGYESLYAAVNLPDDDQLREKIKQVAQEKKVLKPAMLVVVGIGGSSLGMIAVHQALYGILYNAHNPDIALYVADTVDADYLYDIILLVEQELEKGNAVMVNIISKSGSTTETLVNAQLFIHIIRKAYPETYKQYLVITTDEGSALWDCAITHQITRLAIPACVGGRYSVFSAAGLFPLALLGVDIDALSAGARDMRNICISTDIATNMAAVRALLIAEHYSHGIAIHDMFLFSVDLAGVGAWYRQLMGESIGKECLVDGKQIRRGITPTVSIGTTDLHSVGQLYLGGPYVRFSTFVEVKKNSAELMIPATAEIGGLPIGALVQGKSVARVMDAILQGVLHAYSMNKRPFVVLTIPEKNAYYIGMLMQMHMLEIMYLGFLLEVNPFDQPHVELYKQETRKLLNAL